MKRRAEPSSLMSEDEEENYFVSLSDLMTGVLFVFVILTTALALHYHLKAGELEQAKVETIKAIEEAEEAREGAEEAKGKAREAEKDAIAARVEAKKVQEALDALAKILREREKLRKQELEALVSRLYAKGFTVDLDESNGTLRLPERLLFRAGEARLQPSGERALKVLAREMQETVIKGGGTGPLKWEAVYVEGHTDDVPIRTPEFASNWELSSARAINTFKALINAKPDLEYLTNPLGRAIFGISGYGEKRPVADNATDEGRQKNRRIDIRFVMAYPSQAEIEEMEKKLKQATEPTKP
jgi:chemotaxis protein MotB